MPKFNKPCPNCSAKVHVQQCVCKVCHTKLPLGWCKQELPTKGRPKHTNKAAGYNLDKGRAEATTQEDGFKVGKSTGRTKGTTQENGFKVGKSTGRTKGTSREAGFSVSTGRTKETT